MLILDGMILFIYIFILEVQEVIAFYLFCAKKRIHPSNSVLERQMYIFVLPPPLFLLFSREHVLFLYTEVLSGLIQSC